ncbi:hypothetical protein ID855_05790 [Xenorhabdus sp. ZM]|uniref:hypothetical protein n=1 Tax=Xenorhabdus szentirmaii TaxID=290112 RepID=UPI0019B983D8|nr:hypothetical protein [Xenorhabdus sp. ZM]MBD2804220.1 hypothetical protein [Xenorhabdus sp. ZM]
MLSSFTNTLKRILNQPDTTNEEENQSTPEQFLSWALEGLPDEFYGAYIECQRHERPGGMTECTVTHKFKHNAESEYETFSPADELYPAQCIEMTLNDEDWQSAHGNTLLFTLKGKEMIWHF